MTTSISGEAQEDHWMNNEQIELYSRCPVVIKKEKYERECAKSQRKSYLLLNKKNLIDANGLTDISLPKLKKRKLWNFLWKCQPYFKTIYIYSIWMHLTVNQTPF